MTTAKERKQYRIDHGLCPLCGKEAVPYYLCQEHRSRNAFTRMLNRMSDRGIISREKDGGKVYYKHLPGGRSVHDFPWGKMLWEMDSNDKRLRPRLGRRPVDLDDTLIEIFETAGKPLRIDEIIAAWGKLRSKRKTESLAGDMRTIIAAQHKRDAKNARRAAIAARHVSAS
jgi:hypothetical protein